LIKDRSFLVINLKNGHKEKYSTPAVTLKRWGEDQQQGL
jgi:hypothetical protein